MRRGVGVSSALAALGAAGSSAATAALCCAGPFAYGALGAGGVLLAARAQQWAPFVLGAAALLLALAFWAVYRRRSASGAPACSVRSARVARVVVWSAAALTLLAGSVTLFEVLP